MSDGWANELGRARSALIEAELAEHPAERFLQAHLAALRVAAVIVACRARATRRGRLSNIWRLVAEIAPEYAEWAGFFAALQLKREAVLAGASALVSVRDADDLIRDAQAFHDDVAHRFRADRARSHPGVEGAG